ncbi:MAG TPA: hypothetical protein VGP82_24775, partial [Ktedonobacterales bacterium]|nr:hypothetical protein [Ktedonobacterales bacterium]
MRIVAFRGLIYAWWVFQVLFWAYLTFGVAVEVLAATGHVSRSGSLWNVTHWFTEDWLRPVVLLVFL